MTAKNIDCVDNMDDQKHSHKVHKKLIQWNLITIGLGQH